MCILYRKILYSEYLILKSNINFLIETRAYHSYSIETCSFGKPLVMKQQTTALAGHSGNAQLPIWWSLLYCSSSLKMKNVIWLILDSHVLTVWASKAYCLQTCHKSVMLVSCRSLSSNYISACYLGVFKNLEKWERIECGLNKWFCFRDRRTEKKDLPPPPLTRASLCKKYTGTIFLKMICLAIRQLENVKRIKGRKEIIILKTICSFWEGGGGAWVNWC